MRTVAVSWEVEAGRFVARGSNGEHQIRINAPRAPDETRGSTGFSATELLLAAAGACSAWDVIEILRKRRHLVSALDVLVEGQQAQDPPWPYELITLHFRISGQGLRRSVLQRVVRLSCARYCSVLATVSAVARIEATLEMIGQGGRTSGRTDVPLGLGPGLASPLADVPLEPAETLATDEV